MKPLGWTINGSVYNRKYEWAINIIMKDRINPDSKEQSNNDHF